MDAHHTPCPNHPIEALGNPAQIIDKRKAVSIVEKNILVSIPARHQMVESALKLDSKWTGQVMIISKDRAHARYTT